MEEGEGVKQRLKTVMFPLALPSLLIFSFSLNSGVCKRDLGPCLLMRTGDKRTVSTVSFRKRV